MTFQKCGIHIRIPYEITFINQRNKVNTSSLVTSLLLTIFMDMMKK